MANFLPPTAEEEQIDQSAPLRTVEEGDDPLAMLCDLLDENHLYRHAVNKANRRLYILRAQLEMAKETEYSHIDLLEVRKKTFVVIYHAVWN